MSAFKKFKPNDVTLSVYNAQKTFSNQYPSSSVYYSEINAFNNSGSLYPSDEYFELKKNFRSFNQLYYSNFRDGNYQSGSFDNFVQSSFTTGSRQIGTFVKAFAINRDFFGTHIAPNSFTIRNITTVGGEFYIEFESNYVEEDILAGRYIQEA